MAFGVQALGPDIVEAMKYAEAMSSDEVDEVIYYILEEVKLFIPQVDTTANALFFDSTKKTLSVTL